MKKITSAIVIIDEQGRILGCHGTSKPKDSGFDFPKGIVEDNESDIDAAVRELYEETGIELKDKSVLIDCGVHKHNKEKNIHIFLNKVNKFPDIESLQCLSFFETPYGTTLPEVDYFEIIEKKDRHKFNKVLQDKFSIIDTENEK